MAKRYGGRQVKLQRQFVGARPAGVSNARVINVSAPTNPQSGVARGNLDMMRNVNKKRRAKGRRGH